MKIAAVKTETGKQVLIENHKTYAEIAETQKWLDAKMPGWDEFILYRSIKKTVNKPPL